MIYLSTFFGMLMANSYKVYGMEMGIDDALLSIIGACSAITNGLSRAMWAMLMDKFGFKCVYILVMIINLICTATIGYLNGDGIAYLFILSITMGCEGGMFSTFPAITSKIFGHKVGPIIYGFLFFAISISNLTAWLLLKFTYADIGFEGMFWICFGVKVAALIYGILF